MSYSSDDSMELSPPSGSDEEPHTPARAVARDDGGLKPSPSLDSLLRKTERKSSHLQQMVQRLLTAHSDTDTDTDAAQGGTEDEGETPARRSRPRKRAGDGGAQDAGDMYGVSENDGSASDNDDGTGTPLGGSFIEPQDLPPELGSNDEPIDPLVQGGLSHSELAAMESSLETPIEEAIRNELAEQGTKSSSSSNSRAAKAAAADTSVKPGTAHREAISQVFQELEEMSKGSRSLSDDDENANDNMYGSRSRAKKPPSARQEKAVDAKGAAPSSKDRRARSRKRSMEDGGPAGERASPGSSRSANASGAGAASKARRRAAQRATESSGDDKEDVDEMVSDDDDGASEQGADSGVEEEEEEEENGFAQGLARLVELDNEITRSSRALAAREKLERAERRRSKNAAGIDSDDSGEQDSYAGDHRGADDDDDDDYDNEQDDSASAPATAARTARRHNVDEGVSKARDRRQGAARSGKRATENGEKPARAPGLRKSGSGGVSDDSSPGGAARTLTRGRAGASRLRAAAAAVAASRRVAVGARSTGGQTDELRRVRAESAKTERALQEKLRQAKKEAKTVERREADLARRLKEREHRISQHEATIRQQQKDLREIQLKSLKQSKEIQQLKQENGRLSALAERAKTPVRTRGAADSPQAVEKQLGAMRREMSALRDELARPRGAGASAAEKRVARLHERIASMAATLDAAADQQAITRSSTAPDLSRRAAAVVAARKSPAVAAKRARAAKESDELLSDDVDYLQERVSSLAEDLRRRDEKLDAMFETLAAREAELRDRDRELDALRAQVARVSRLRHADSDEEDDFVDAAGGDSGRGDMARALRNARILNEELTIRVNALEQTVDERNDEAKALRRRVKKLQERSATSEDAEDRIRALQRKNKRLREQVDELHESAVRRVRRIQKLEDDLDRRDAEIWRLRAQARERIADLADSAAGDAGAAPLEGSLARALDEALQSLETAAASAQQGAADREAAARREAAERAAAAASATERAAAAERDAAAARAEAAQAGAEARDAAREHADLLRAYEALQERASAAESDAAAAGERAEEADRRRADVEAQLHESEEELGAAEARVAELEERVQELDHSGSDSDDADEGHAALVRAAERVAEAELRAAETSDRAAELEERVAELEERARAAEERAEEAEAAAMVAAENSRTDADDNAEAPEGEQRDGGAGEARLGLAMKRDHKGRWKDGYLVLMNGVLYWFTVKKTPLEMQLENVSVTPTDDDEVDNAFIIEDAESMIAWTCSVNDAEGINSWALSLYKAQADMSDVGDSILQPIREDEAATTIQRRYREHAARKRASLLRQERETERKSEVWRQECAACVLQAAYRGLCARRALREQHDAATALQAVFRGSVARKRAADARAAALDGAASEEAREQEIRAAEEAAAAAAAAVTVQAAFRGKRARERAAGLREAERAATTVQAAFRGKHARERAASLREAAAAEAERAATTVQAAFRGKRAREHAAGLRAATAAEAERAATTVQAVFRGKRARADLAHQRDAATTVQAAFRGKQARSALGKQRDAATTVQAAFRGHAARGALAAAAAATAAAAVAADGDSGDEGAGEVVAFPGAGAASRGARFASLRRSAQSTPSMTAPLTQMAEEDALRRVDSAPKLSVTPASEDEQLSSDASDGDDSSAYESLGITRPPQSPTDVDADDVLGSGSNGEEEEEDDDDDTTTADERTDVPESGDDAIDFASAVGTGQRGLLAASRRSSESLTSDASSLSAASGARLHFRAPMGLRGSVPSLGASAEPLERVRTSAEIAGEDDDESGSEAEGTDEENERAAASASEGEEENEVANDDDEDDDEEGESAEPSPRSRGSGASDDLDAEIAELERNLAALSRGGGGGDDADETTGTDSEQLSQALSPEPRIGEPARDSDDEDAKGSDGDEDDAAAAHSSDGSASPGAGLDDELAAIRSELEGMNYGGEDRDGRSGDLTSEDSQSFISAGSDAGRSFRDDDDDIELDNEIAELEARIAQFSGGAGADEESDQGSDQDRASAHSSERSAKDTLQEPSRGLQQRQSSFERDMAQIEADLDVLKRGANDDDDNDNEDEDDDYANAGEESPRDESPAQSEDEDDRDRDTSSDIRDRSFTQDTTTTTTTENRDSLLTLHSDTSRGAVSTTARPSVGDGTVEPLIAEAARKATMLARTDSSGDVADGDRFDDEDDDRGAAAGAAAGHGDDDGASSSSPRKVIRPDSVATMSSSYSSRDEDELDDEIDRLQQEIMAMEGEDGKVPSDASDGEDAFEKLATEIEGAGMLKGEPTTSESERDGKNALDISEAEEVGSMNSSDTEDEFDDEIRKLQAEILELGGDIDSDGNPRTSSMASLFESPLSDDDHDDEIRRLEEELRDADRQLHELDTNLPAKSSEQSMSNNSTASEVKGVNLKEIAELAAREHALSPGMEASTDDDYTTTGYTTGGGITSPESDARRARRISSGTFTGADGDVSETDDLGDEDEEEEDDDVDESDQRRTDVSGSSADAPRASGESQDLEGETSDEEIRRLERELRELEKSHRHMSSSSNLSTSSGGDVHALTDADVNARSSPSDFQTGRSSTEQGLTGMSDFDENDVEIVSDENTLDTHPRRRGSNETSLSATMGAERVEEFRSERQAGDAEVDEGDPENDALQMLAEGVCDLDEAEDTLMGIMLIVPQTQVENAAFHLLRVGEAFGCPLRVVRALARFEFHLLSSSPTTIMRTDSLTTKTISLYLRSRDESDEYLRTLLGNIIDELCKPGVDLEINPAKASNLDVVAASHRRSVDEELRARQTRIIEFAQHILEQITSGEAMDSMPRSIRAVAGVIGDLAETYNFEVAPLVGGFIMLRWLCPALSPARAQRYRANPGKMTRAARRNLTLVTKLLQKLSNMVTFDDREAYMMPLNGFITSNRDLIQMYLEVLRDDPNDDEGSTEMWADLLALTQQPGALEGELLVGDEALRKLSRLLHVALRSDNVSAAAKSERALQAIEDLRDLCNSLPNDTALDINAPSGATSLRHGQSNEFSTEAELTRKGSDLSIGTTTTTATQRSSLVPIRKISDDRMNPAERQMQQLAREIEVGIRIEGTAYVGAELKAVPLGLDKVASGDVSLLWRWTRDEETPLSETDTYTVTAEDFGESITVHLNVLIANRPTQPAVRIAGPVKLSPEMAARMNEFVVRKEAKFSVTNLDASLSEPYQLKITSSEVRFKPEHEKRSKNKDKLQNVQFEWRYNPIEGVKAVMSSAKLGAVNLQFPSDDDKYLVQLAMSILPDAKERKRYFTLVR